MERTHDAPAVPPDHPDRELARGRRVNTSVAVLGAGGIMGLPMARNLARAGFEVRAWNRSRDKAEQLSSDGVRVAATPAEAAGGAGIVLTMLSDTDAVIGAMSGENGALAAMTDPAIWLQMSTIGEEGTERCARLAQEHGIGFVDAPVLGTKGPAEQGTLVVMASGPEALRPLAQPVFGIVGGRTMWVGAAGAATALKLVVNSWVLSVVEAGAEAIALAEGLGLDPALLFEALDGGPLDVPYLRAKGRAMIERSFEPSFRLALAAKDAGLVEQAATRRGLDLPLHRVIRERMAQGVEQHGDKDMSATYLTSSPRAPAP
jgi:3-hydroxyisobutyrate dehydrogenase